MKTVFPAQYVTEALLPKVANVLYVVCQEFGCDLRWTRDSKEKPGAPEEFHAQPITPSDVDAFGVRRDVHTNFWYGESQGERLEGETTFRRGKHEGYVRFRASMNARMSISKGLDLFDATDDGRRRFLCWADQYELGDGSTCFRLNTSAGFLWVRGADQSGVGTRMLHLGLDGEGGAPKPKDSAVVELAEYDFCRSVGEKPFYEQTPWDGMMSTDRTGRQWHIVKGSLNLYCALRLDVVGRYNNRLKDKPRQVVKRPYQTAWERWVGDDEKLLVPLDYC